jgi:hypothetical protein
VEAIMIHERDQVLLHTLATTAEEAGPSSCIVGILGQCWARSREQAPCASSLSEPLTEDLCTFSGEAHLPGIARLAMRGACKLTKEEIEALQGTGVAPRESAAQLGVRRAILESFLRLSCRPEILQDMKRVRIALGTGWLLVLATKIRLLGDPSQHRCFAGSRPGSQRPFAKLQPNA